MSIPNLPTDNLYKFLSISGIFITVVSLSSLYFNSKTLNTEIIETNRKIAHYGYKISEWSCESEQLDYIFRFEKELKGLKDTIDGESDLDSFPLCAEMPMALIYSYYRDLSFLDERFKNFLDLKVTSLINHKKVDSLELEIEYDIKLIDYKILLLKRNKTFSLIAGFIGIILSFLGFYLWYNRSQRYLDEKLKIESEVN